MSRRRGSKLGVGELGQADKPPEDGAHSDNWAVIDRAGMEEHGRGYPGRNEEGERAEGEEGEESDDNDNDDDDDGGGDGDDDDDDDDDENNHEIKKESLEKIEQKLNYAANGTTPLDREAFLVEHGDDLDYIWPESDSEQRRNVLHLLAKANFQSDAMFPTWILDHIHDNAKKKAEQGGRKRNSGSLSALMKSSSHYDPGLPLAWAVRFCKVPFIRAVLDCEKRLGITLDLSDNFRKRIGNTNGNVIHYAIEKLEPILAVQLIRRAKNDACLTTTNNDGHTPLHLAAKYPECLGRLPIIKALLKYGEEALTEPHGSGLSVYRHYEETKSKELQEKEKREREPPAAAADGTSTPSGAAARAVKIGEEPAMGPPDRGNKDLTPPIQDPREKRADKPHGEIGTHDAGAVVGTDAAHSQPTGDPRKALKRTPTGAAEAAPATTNTKKKGKKKKGINNSLKAKTSASLAPTARCKPEEVEDEIKLQYFRGTWKHIQDHEWNALRTVRKFLYPDVAVGETRVTEFGWSLIQGPEMMDEHVFRDIYGEWTFDSTLRHVAVRRLMFNRPENNEAGRTDMEILFKLLRDRNVRHIVKLIVLDLEKPAHSDMSIENCLSGFKTIEILDWRKLDICPQTIIKACRDVVELHLYWSGSNGILRAWSAIDGLATLPRLSKVYIHQRQYFEAPQRDSDNLEAFKQRLKHSRDSQQAVMSQGVSRKQATDEIEVLDSWQDITVDCDDTSMKKQGDLSLKLHRSRRNHMVGQLQRYDWLTIMDNFAAGMRCINLEQDEMHWRHADVRVALIDDGVEITNANLTDRVYNGWTCESGYKGDGLDGIPRPHTSSETQHGTFMASTIVRVCPKARIFVFRLDVATIGDDGRAHFTAKSAADALELAVDAKREFDIISMSWNITESNDQNSLNRIKDSLDKAKREGKLLLFCATPDQGEMSNTKMNQIYPFGVQDAGLFRIAGATEFGTPTPNAGKGYDFLLPGHEVDEAPGAGNEARQQLLLMGRAGDSKDGAGRTGSANINTGLKTGSSVATALGAGLAALIIYCVRLAAAYDQEPPGTDSGTRSGKKREIKWEDVRSPSKMRSIFADMANSRGAKPGENHKYVDVWRDFRDVADKLKPLGDTVKKLDAKIKTAEARGDVKAAETLKEERKGEIDKMMAIIFQLAVSFNFMG